MSPIEEKGSVGFFHVCSDMRSHQDRRSRYRQLFELLDDRAAVIRIQTGGRLIKE
ncbi:hypothetical protein CMASS_01745 [Corynebacterium massiliense DSM 45435]|uniref:Uncharacterized protein n=1 Tax=Corynebacterium massiliense DSM 45435 TaxID=1121364 RepID=A0ABY7U546_9CORY|nr:hypothetical protein CMASS_01745 [Corynebacterium massiliense DSM 45435]